MKIQSALASLILLAAPASNAVTPDDGTPTSLRQAITDLSLTFGARYPGGTGFLKRLDALGPQPAPDALAALRREALLANPLLDIEIPATPKS